MQRFGLVQALSILTADGMGAAIGLQKGLREAPQHLVTAETEDEVGVRVVERQLHQLGVGEMPVAAQHDVGLRPGRPHAFEHALDDHGVLGPGRALAGTQGGGDEVPGDPLEEKQRQIAVATVVVVVETELLLTVGGVLGVIHVQHDDGRWDRITGDELIDVRLGDAVEVFGSSRILQARDRGSAGQIAFAVQWPTLQPELEHRIAPQRVRVVAVLIGAGDLIDALGNEVAHWVRDVAGVTLVVNGGGYALGQPDLAVDTAQDQGAEIR